MRFPSLILSVFLFSAVIFSVRGDEVSKSPFEPTGVRSQKKTTNVNPAPKKAAIPLNPISNEIEMRGYFKLGDVYYFSIHQKKMDLSSKRKKSEWIQIGEEAFDQFTVKDFNPETMKLIVARDTDRVLGVHMVGADAPEIIQGFAVALKCGATKAQFDATVGIHPSAAEEFVTMRHKISDDE